MAYERQTFVDQEVDENGDVVVAGTTLKKAHLDHIEDGILAVEATAEAAKTAAEAVTKELPTVTAADDGKILQVVGGQWAAVAITDGNNVAY